ncbi:MAG: hypothetical protein K6A64_11210 [Bacteroidales bacterium]|nr:hypothetical protein [Bacteroidales bacterium]
MKKILSILTLLSVLVVIASCDGKKVYVDESASTAPVLTNGSGSANGLSADFTAGELNVNNKYATYTLAIVKLDGKPVSKVVKSKLSGTKLTATAAEVSRSLALLGCKVGDEVSFEAAVRMTLNADLDYGGVDSENHITVEKFTLIPFNENKKRIKKPELEGYGLFVDATSSPIYSEALTLYAWGEGLSDATDLFGAWPGMVPSGKVEDYVYFDLGAKTSGKVVNFILNNNNGGNQLENFDLLKNQTIDKHFFFKITDDNVEEAAVEFYPSYTDVDLSGKEQNEVMAGAETWGVIGTATEGGWDYDQDMQKISADPEIWVVKDLKMTDGKFKFRGNDTWAAYDLGGGSVTTYAAFELSKGGGDMEITEGTYTIYLFPTYMLCFIEE